MPERQVTVKPTPDDVAVEAARLIAERARMAVGQGGRFTFALSGGSSVAAIYERLAADPGVDWSRVHLFWGDERFVERDNPYSNYALAERSLIARAPGLPAGNVHAVPTDAPTPAEGAARYADEIRRFFGLGPGEWPRFDLCLNGMGPDGHTASLFPHSAALDCADDIAAMNHAGLHPWVDRVTLTLPVFAHARCVLFAATGAGKAATLAAVLGAQADVHALPAAGVQPTDGELIWLLDRAIALRLPG